MAELKNCTTNFYPELCGVNVIVDPRSQLGVDDDRLLIIGQKGTGATAADNSVQQVRDDTRAALFGADSMLNRMIDEAREQFPTTELFAFVLPNAGTAGEAEVTITGVPAASGPGIVYLFVNGRTYQAAFDPAVDTNQTLAAKFAALITSNDPTLGAVAALGVLTITTEILGEIGGFLDVRASYGVRLDLASHPDITVAIAMTAATGVPDLSALATLGQGYEFVAMPYTDDNAVADLSAYLCGQWSGGANSRAYGVFYGTDTDAIVLGQTTNNALVSFAAINGALTPPYLETMSYAGIMFRRLNCQSADIAASLTGERMPAMLAPEIADRFTPAEEAALVEAGIGYFRVTRVNDVNIGRAVTTYTVADNGTLDQSFRDVNRPAMTACISRYLREQLTAKYTGYAFRRDGIVGRTSDKVATEAGIRNFIISLGGVLSDRNLVQDIPGFIASLSVEYDAETGCVAIRIDPELVNQFCCANVTLRTI